MSKMTNSEFRFPANDAFEAIDFNAGQLSSDDARLAQDANIEISFLTSVGQKLTMQFKPSAASFTQLATWATEVATILTAQGRK